MFIFFVTKSLCNFYVFGTKFFEITTSVSHHKNMKKIWAKLACFENVWILKFHGDFGDKIQIFLTQAKWTFLAAPGTHTNPTDQTLYSYFLSRSSFIFTTLFSSLCLCEGHPAQAIGVNIHILLNIYSSDLSSPFSSPFHSFFFLFQISPSFILAGLIIYISAYAIRRSLSAYFEFLAVESPPSRPYGCMAYRCVQVKFHLTIKRSASLQICL